MAISALSPNRITRALAEVSPRVDALSEQDRAQLDADMSLTAQEYWAYQTAQSTAHASGRITTAEAQMIYAALGGSYGSNGGWAAGVTTAEKCVITLTMGALL